MKFVIVLFVLIATRLVAVQDCIPNTFTTITFLLGKPTKNEMWMKEFYPTGKEATPTLRDALDIWHKKEPEIALTPFYSALKVMAGNQKEFDTKIGVPYFWVGELPKEMVADPSAANAHAAVVYFFKNNVVLVSTVNAKDVPFNSNTAFDFFIETLDYDTFIKRTYWIFKIETTGVVKYTSLLELLTIK